MAEKNEMDETSHSIEWKIENFAFIDSESIRAVGHLTLTSLFEQERQSVLARLPEAYTKRFRTVGFYQDKPVLIVSPYDVPYGRIRRLWMEIFFQFVRWIDNEPKTFLENMPHLVHDFQCLQAGPECSVSLIPGTAIETFENGAACNLDSLPKGIQRKLMNKINPVPLTDAERVTVRGFENMIPFIDREVGRPPLLPWTCWTDPLNDCDMLHVVERLPVIVIPSETVDPRADRSFGTTVELWGPSDEARHLAKIIKYHGDFTLVEYSDGQRQWLPLQNQRVAFMTDNHVGQVVSCVKSADDSYEQNVTVKAESYVNVPNDKETSYSEGLDPVTAKRAETSALDAPKQICASLPETLLANSTRMRNESASPDAVVVCETTTSLLRHAAPASEKRSASPIPRESMLQKRYRTSGPPAQVMDADHPLLHVPRKERQKNNVFVEKSLSTPAEQAMKVPEPSEPLQVSQNRDVAGFFVVDTRPPRGYSSNQVTRSDNCFQYGSSGSRKESCSSQPCSPDRYMAASEDTIYGQMSIDDLAHEVSRKIFHVTKSVLVELLQRPWHSVANSNLPNTIRRLTSDKNFRNDATHLELGWSIDRKLSFLLFEKSRDNNFEVGARRIRRVIRYLVELSTQPWFQEALFFCKRQETLEKGVESATEYLRRENAPPIAAADLERLLGNGVYI